MNELTIVPDALVPAGSAGARYATRDPDDRLGVRLWYVRVLVPSPLSAVPAGALRRGIQIVETEREFHQADIVGAARSLEPGASSGIDVQ